MSAGGKVAIGLHSNIRLRFGKHGISLHGLGYESDELCKYTGVIETFDGNISSDIAGYVIETARSNAYGK